jgi:cytochrome P450
VSAHAALMAEESASLAERWARELGGTGVLDAHVEMTRLTLRVLGRAVFGQDVEEAIDIVRRAFPVDWFRRVASPVSLPPSWPTPGNRAAVRAREALYGGVEGLIARRRENAAGGDDLLSRLLAARDPDTGAPMPVQRVRDEALIFLLAGHETTSTALTFTLHLLGQHPAEQQRVLNEVDRVLGRRPPDRGRRSGARARHDGHQGGAAAVSAGARVLAAVPERR